MTRRISRLSFAWAAVPALVLAAAWTSIATAEGGKPRGEELLLEEARIFFEFNQTDDDLGVHVLVDGEDWIELAIESPTGQRIFAVRGQGGFRQFGMTELFLEGAEPSLSDVPLEELLRRFPEGEYRFSGLTVDGEAIGGTATLTHAVPAGPEVEAQVAEDSVRIRWRTVTEGAEGFPERPISIAGYQIIVEDGDDAFQVTLPASATSVTLPPEFVASLDAGEHGFEVLAIEEGGNLTITADSFEL